MKWGLIVLLILAAVAALLGALALIGAFLPRAHTASRTARLPVAPDALFAILRDFAALPTWRRDLRSVELLPARDGAPRYRELSRHGAVAYIVREELLARRLVVEIDDATLPYGGRWTFELSPAPGGTDLRLTEDGFVKNVLFRFLARFVFGHTATMDSYLRDLARRLDPAASSIPPAPSR